jgi:glycosyltransferase involved in cell wall biosynthesis
LVSVVTVVYNGEKHLAQAMDSVLRQDYDNVEYIVVDGGSDDGTLGLVAEREQAIDYWSSAADRGIYHAMNKGLAEATGNVVGILNADDWYSPGALSAVAASHADNPAAVIHGGMAMVREDRELYRLPAPGTPASLAKGMVLNHPAVFVPRAVYREHGTFDESFAITADWDLMVRLWRAGVEFRPLDQTLANFRLGGASYAFGRAHVEERRAVRRKNGLCGEFDRHYLLDRLKLLFPGELVMQATLLKQKFASGGRGNPR